MSDTPPNHPQEDRQLPRGLRAGPDLPPPRRQDVTDGLFAVFTDFSMATNPLCKNARYARAYGYQGLVCPPGLVMLVAFSQTVEDISENARANLEYIDMRFGAPVYVGDTIEVETKHPRRATLLEPSQPGHRPRCSRRRARTSARADEVGGDDLAAQGAGLQGRRERRRSKDFEIEPEHGLRATCGSPNTAKS